jgi:hypothetical protein
MSERFDHCPSCGRRHAPRLCTETPKGADSWKRVIAARNQPSPLSPTDLTAGNA